MFVVSVAKGIFKTTLFLLLVIACVACLPVAPSDDDLVGAWAEGRPISDPCTTITFLRNGRFEARNLPAEYFRPEFPAKWLTGGGFWNLEPGRDPFAWHVLRLDFRVTPESRGYDTRYGTSMYVIADGEQFIVFKWVRDEAERIEFFKTAGVNCDAR